MLRRALIVAALAVATASGSAQTYPSGPVKVIVPYAEGGSADIFARTISPGLAKALGQPVAVENHPGGGGAAGVQAVARATADGRTLLLGQTGEIVVQPYFMKQAGPRPDPVALVAVIPLAVVVPAAAPYSRVE